MKAAAPDTPPLKRADEVSMQDTEKCARQLEDYFKNHIDVGAVIAYSGGVDSGLLSYVSHLILGDAMIAVLADSPSLARREYCFALDFIKKHRIPIRIVQTEEMENPLYKANSGNRCYYCKKALFKKIGELLGQLDEHESKGPRPIFYGLNQDDLADYRPGIQAAIEASVLSPYIELGFNKKTIRNLCGYYGLEIADKPAMPCMSSRIPHGREVTPEKLNQVEKAEDFLLDIGFRVLRVRHHDDTARIEVQPMDFERLLKERKKICKRFRELGFLFIALDLDGFHSGSLNAGLTPEATV
ncbi:MAG: TIGR00268 family protein [Desulfobacterium sp.]|nr:TIGR00268 family protein [Desulfobacterium sp.]